MALIIPGKTPCSLCEQPISNAEDAIGFPAFLPKYHHLSRFSDNTFHIQCFQSWSKRQEFEQLYQTYRSIWDSRPRELKTLKESEAWGKEAFKKFFSNE